MSERILVVDDEAGIRSTLSDILEDEGYQIASAASAATAAAAAERLATEPFDAVLLDLWLPDRDGLELLSELQGRGFAPPVIVISGHGTIDTAVQAVRLGAYDFLEKPPAVRGGEGNDGDGEPARAVWETDYPSLQDARAAFERFFIAQKLAELDGNVSLTARALGLERSHLYRKMRTYGIR